MLNHTCLLERFDGASTYTAHMTIVVRVYHAISLSLQDCENVIGIIVNMVKSLKTS